MEAAGHSHDDHAHHELPSAPWHPGGGPTGRPSRGTRLHRPARVWPDHDGARRQPRRGDEPRRDSAGTRLRSRSARERTPRSAGASVEHRGRRRPSAPPFRDPSRWRAREPGELPVAQGVTRVRHVRPPSADTLTSLVCNAA